MPATDSSLMDYVVTYGGPSIFMTAVFVFVLPLVYFKFARPRYARWPARLAVLFGVWCLAFGVAYGDVFLIARDAKRLCETEAGMKIYRTVEAEGFAGVSSLGAWSERGFDFVEIEVEYFQVAAAGYTDVEFVAADSIGHIHIGAAAPLEAAWAAVGDFAVIFRLSLGGGVGIHEKADGDGCGRRHDGVRNKICCLSNQCRHRGYY